MRLRTPFLMVVVAGAAGVASAQNGAQKDPTGNALRDVKLYKSQAAPAPGGFGPRVAATDQCADAPAVGNGDTITFDLTQATNDYPGTCGASSGSADQWVKVTASENILCTVTTCGLAGGDTVLLATDACGGAVVTCNDDSCGLQSRIIFSVDAGQTRYIRIAGFAGNVFAGQASVTTTPRGGGGGAAADQCADAPLVGVGVHDFDLGDASNDYPGTCGGTGSAPDKWFKFTTGANSQRLTASTCSLSGFDTVLALIDGCGGSTLACVDDACGLQSTVSAILPASTTVLVRIAGYAGQVGSGQLELSVVDVTPPANDRCADAESLSVGTPVAFDTTFADDDGAAGCGFNGNPGVGSVWYKFTSDRDGAVEVFTCDGTAFDTIVSMYEGCDGAEVGCNDDSCALQSYFLANVANGVEYRIRVSGYLAARGSGTLTVNYAEPCVLTQPPGAVLENEDCQSDTATDRNGGCNDPELEVQTVAYDTTIYGTASTFIDPASGGQYRDTDWYEVAFDGGTFTATGHAAFNLRLFILDTACPPAILTTAAGTRPCQEVVVTADLAAGTYRVFAGLDGFTGLDCGGAVDNHYVLTIGAAGGGCIADFNGDGFVDFFDYSDYVGCFETGICPPGRTADVNGDDFVDFFDYADFVDAFETGC